MPTNNQPNNSSTTTTTSAAASTSSSSGRPQKLADALRVLDQAIMSEGANLKELVTKDYTHLQTALKDFAPQVSQVTEKFRSSVAPAFEAVQGYTGPAMEKGKEAFATVDRQVKANPWPILAGAAIGSLALGFLLGRSNSK